MTTPPPVDRPGELDRLAADLVRLDDGPDPDYSPWWDDVHAVNVRLRAAGQPAFPPIELAEAARKARMSTHLALARR